VPNLARTHQKSEIPCAGNIGLMLISVIVPFYNEVDILEEAVLRIRSAISSTDADLELLLVDNRSDDGSFELAKQMCQLDSRLKLIRLSRNFGPMTEPSILAGLQNSVGDAVAIVYSDMQDPPEYIPEMYSKLCEGFDVAYGVRKSRSGDTLVFRLFSALFYKTLSRLSDSPTHGNSGDFIMMSRRVVDHLLSLDEVGRFTRALVPWIGFESAVVMYDRAARKTGRSKTRPLSALSTALLGITSFSQAPLRILLLFGFVTAALSVGALALQFFLWATGSPVPGLTTLIALALLNLGVVTFAISVVGEYVGRVMTEVKRRPLFIIDSKINFPG